MHRTEYSRSHSQSKMLCPDPLVQRASLCSPLSLRDRLFLASRRVPCHVLALQRSSSYGRPIIGLPRRESARACLQSLARISHWRAPRSTAPANIHVLSVLILRSAALVRSVTLFTR